jgi:hypothetical protein
MSAVEKQVDYLANRMGLVGWKFTIKPAEAASDSWAEVEVVYGRKQATIFLSDAWDSLPVEEQKQVLVHELAHVHLAAYTQLVNDLFESQHLTKEVIAAANAALAHCEEWLVDNLAEAWTKTL